MDTGMPTIDPAFCDYCMAAYWVGPCSWHENYRNDPYWLTCVTRFRVRKMIEGFVTYYKALFGKDPV